MPDHLAMKEHTFAMHLTPSGRTSEVLLDGESISHLLKGVTIDTSMDGTIVTLHCASRHFVTLTAQLPEAQILIIACDETPDAPRPPGGL